jgi:hypothetical protein
MFVSLLVFLLMFGQFSPFVVPVRAASSPWAQTDWSTGGYDSVSNVTTSTAGQVTLTNTEKLSNTGFESDLTGWDTSAAVYDSEIAAAINAVAAWPMDDITTTQSYSRAINPSLATGRNMVLNGSFDSDTLWTKGSGWTITGGVAHSDGTGASSSLRQSITATAGKVYEITFTISNYVSGTVRPIMGGNSNGTNRTANGTYTENLVSGTSASADIFLQTNTNFVGDIDNVTVKQLSVPAYDATPSQTLTDGNMETSGTGNWTAFNLAVLSKQTTSPHGGSQHLRIAVNGATGPAAGQTVFSIGTPYRVYGYARSDGSATPRIRDSAGSTLWTGTTSTSWQSFDFTFIAAATGLRLDTTSSTLSQYVEFDDVTVALNTGIRQGELTQDGDMETSGTGIWVSAQSATLSKQTSSPHGGSQVLRVAYNGVSSPGGYQSILSNGRRYRITGYFRGDGTFAPRVLYGGTVGVSGTSSTSWQSFDITISPTGGTNLELRSLATSAGYAEFDDVTVTEINPLSGAPTGGVTLGSTSGGHLTKAYTFDGVNDLLNIYSTDLNSTVNPSEGTVVLWAKVSGSGVWTDSTTRQLFQLTADASNILHIRKNTTSNQINFSYTAGGTQESISISSLSYTDWFQVALSWSKTSDEVKAYINGAQVGSTQTSLGTWAGNIVSSGAVIGALNTSGTNPWSGMINDVRLYNTALSGSQISTLYTGSATTRDTSRTYNSTTGSAKIVGASDLTTNFTQSLNVGDTNTYSISAYAYTNGTAVTTSDAQLLYNGSAISTTYTSVGGGWYQLSGNITGANESRTYGVQIKPGKTVYLDNLSVNNYASSGTLTSSIFDSGQGSNWGTLTYSGTTPTDTTITVKARTSNSSTMSGADDFSSCSAITSANDISSNICVTDTDRYIQYQVTLASSTLLVTPTFSDISITFETSDDVGPTFELDSPGSNSYTNNERPTFRWKAATDVSSSVSDYNLIIDNPSLGTGNPSGDFVISDIPISRTEDYVTNKYVVHYDGFSDSDLTNNYISIYTKSSNEWGSSENDGKLREGKVTWSVESTDTAGNKTSIPRVLFVDRTSPSVSLTQINDVAADDAIFTTDKTPTIYGKIVDSLAGGDQSVTQNESGHRVASGPKQVEIKIEKKQGLIYILHTSYTINTDKAWYTCDDTVVSDNSKQKCDKYLPFEYTQKDNLDLGTYRLTVTGKDNADNSSSTKSITLNITTYSQITTTEEKKIVEEEIKSLPREKQKEVKDTLEITKPSVPDEPNIISKAGENAVQASGNILSSIRDMLGNLGNGIAYLIQNVTGKVGNAVVWAVTGTWKNMTWLASRTTDGILSLTRFITSTSYSIAGTVGNTMYVIAQNNGKVITAIASAIGNGYNNIAESTPGVVRGVMLSIGNSVTTTGRFVGTSITNVSAIIQNTTSNTARGLGQIATNTGNGIGNVSSSLGTGIMAVTNNTSKVIGTLAINTSKGLGSIVSSTADMTKKTHRVIVSGTTNIAFNIGERAQNVSGTIGLAIIKFTYNFVPEPTTISDVKVAKSTPTSMTITWTTNHPATSKVNYGLTPDYGQDVQSTKRVTRHEVTITGLQPNTTYSYEVMSQNKNYVYDANHLFKTPE